MRKLNLKEIIIGYILGISTFYLLKFSIYFIIIFLLLVGYMLYKNENIRRK